MGRMYCQGLRLGYLGEKTMKMSLLAILFAGVMMAGTVGAEEAGAAKTQTVTLNVKGMMCGGCEKAVAGTYKKVEGVTDVKADNAAGTATVTYDPTKTNPEALAKALTGKFTAEVKKG